MAFLFEFYCDNNTKKLYERRCENQDAIFGITKVIFYNITMFRVWELVE